MPHQRQSVFHSLMKFNAPKPPRLSTAIVHRLALAAAVTFIAGCANFGDHIVVDPFFRTQMNMQGLNQFSPRDLGLKGLGPSCHPPSPRR